MENLKSLIHEVKHHNSIDSLKEIEGMSIDTLFDEGRKEYEKYSLKRKAYRNKIIYGIYEIWTKDKIKNDIRILENNGDYSISIKIGENIKFVIDISNDFNLIFKFIENEIDLTGWKIAYIDTDNISYQSLSLFIINEMNKVLPTPKIEAIKRDALKPDIKFSDYLKFQNKLEKDLNL